MKKIVHNIVKFRSTLLRWANQMYLILLFQLRVLFEYNPQNTSVNDVLSTRKTFNLKK